MTKFMEFLIDNINNVDLLKYSEYFRADKFRIKNEHFICNAQFCDGCPLYGVCNEFGIKDYDWDGVLEEALNIEALKSSNPEYFV